MLEPVVCVVRPPWETQGPGEESVRALGAGVQRRGNSSLGRVIQEPRLK